LRDATNGDPDVLDNLPRLPFADRELKALQTVYPDCTVLSGLDATEDRVRSLFDQQEPVHYDVIHFSTHALSDTPIRQRCALALSRRGTDRSPLNDGLVDALEIQLGWKLDANLVTLSACQTASGWSFFRGEPTGLAGVLLGAGARSVLASVWKVDDLATTMLMSRFYEDLSGRYSDVRAGLTHTAMPKDVALAEAKNWLRAYTAPGGRRPFAHPAYWSGFILMGAPD
jgi:CHAT domain-containing protein